MSFEIEWRDNDAHVRFYGELTFNDFREVNGMIYGNSKFDHMNYQIADFTDVSCVNLTEGEIFVISSLEEHATRWNRRVKVAHVTKDGFLQTLVRAYEKKMQNTNWICRMFEDVEDAKKWCVK